jgi:hypothetical protein
MYSHIPASCRKMGSALRQVNSSTLIPSMVGSRRTRFIFPLMKTVWYCSRLRFFSAFWAAVSRRFRFVFFLSSFSFFLLISGVPRWPGQPSR